MATKNSSSALVSGLGMGMAFIQALVNEIVALGGFEEMLHPLSRDHGRPILKQLAELIVKSEWRVPKSLIERLAAEKSLVDQGPEYVEFDKRFWWNQVNLSEKFGIPVVTFSNDRSDHCLPVPEEILAQLRGKKIVYPMLLKWENESHVVVALNGESGWQLGEKTLPNFTLRALWLAPAKYFDLER